MEKKGKIYIGLFIGLVLSIIFYEYSKPKPINWFPSYAKKHKIPYGTYVLRNELKTLFPKSTIKNVNIPPYQFLQDESKSGTYIFINNTMNFDDAEFKHMMQFVERGNTIFMSTHGFIIDTLNVKTKGLVTTNIKERPFFKILNKNLVSKEFLFDRIFSNQVFIEIDTLNTTVLSKTGYLDADGNHTEEGVNFIKLNFGKGTFFFHSFPEVFTNYSLLKDNNHEHAAAILSYLNDGETIFWDEYYKTGKSKITSPMNYLLSQPSLKWAYYLVLLGVLFFIIFEGRRKQRLIPIRTPLKNQTVAFTRTIANMYFESSEHKNIAEHRIGYLLDFIRLKLRIPTHKMNKTFYNYVASRSGNSVNDIKNLFDYCDQIHIKNTITKEELLELNRLIEDFKKSIN